jgi:hypothetical protein
VTEEELQCHERFLADCTFPLMGVVPGTNKRAISGTGTLFRIAGVDLIVTAAHVAHELHQAGLAIPFGLKSDLVVPRRLTGLVELGHDFEVVVTSEDTSDIALIKLKPTDLERFHYRSLTLDNVLTPATTDAGSSAFVLSGFPAEVVDAERRSDVERPRIFETFLYPKDLAEADPPPDPPLDPAHHFLLSNLGEGRDPKTGEVKPWPKLQGISGCSAWMLVEPADKGVWAPERQLKIAGMETSALKGKWLRCTRWVSIAELISTAIPETAAEIRRAFGVDA